VKASFKILLNKRTPIRVPRMIGSKNLVFFLISLKKNNTEFIIFSYIPKITQKTPLLIPGKMAPHPIKIPVNKFFISITIQIFIGSCNIFCTSYISIEKDL